MMGTFLSSYSVADLSIGKPPLKQHPISTTIADTLLALESCNEDFISIWGAIGRCVGSISIVDIVYFWCKDRNLSRPASEVLVSPVALLLKQRKTEHVVHVDQNCSLIHAIDLMIGGAQRLVVPIEPKQNKEFCWLTVEDFIRFLFESIDHSTIAYTPVSELNGLVVSADLFTVKSSSPAVLAVERLALAYECGIGVAVVDDDRVLLGEISKDTIVMYGEMILPCLAALTAGELMSYTNCKWWNKDVAKVLSKRLNEPNLEKMLVDLKLSDKAKSLSGKRKMRSAAEGVTCHLRNSLVAVMMQAVTHRVGNVWVVEEESGGLVGVIGLVAILKVLRDNLVSK